MKKKKKKNERYYLFIEKIKKIIKKIRNNIRLEVAGIFSEVSLYEKLAQLDEIISSQTRSKQTGRRFPIKPIHSPLDVFNAKTSTVFFFFLIFFRNFSLFPYNF